MDQNIDLSSSTPYVCDECGHDTFRTVFKIRQISALMSPSGESMLVPIPTIVIVVERKQKKASLDLHNRNKFRIFSYKENSYGRK